MYFSIAVKNIITQLFVLCNGIPDAGVPAMASSVHQFGF